MIFSGATSCCATIVSRGRWDVDGFEAQTPSFVTGITDRWVGFAYQGQRTAEIAHAFHRSPLTIKSQLTSIFTKLGVKNRAQVAALLNR